MSFLDRIAAAVTPAATDEQRAEARQTIEQMTPGEDWLRMIVDQHKRIEGLFAQGLSAGDATSRVRIAKDLATELTGHANAEEAIVYPIVSEDSGKSHAGMGYEEQAMTKIQLAKLEQIDPMSKEWTEKLEHIQGAVAQHVYQEESSWFPDIVRNTPLEKRELLNKRFREEYERYCGTTAELA